ncbi:MAG: molecular chaperone HtpG [Burkholderiaceae bacterium]|jgi:molecular chaperone HtpG
MTTTDKQTLGFQTEIRQLLDLMIHSLYSNREIFLRELISNASDACDKLRFLAIDDDKMYEGDSELGIRIAVDRAARSLTIIDNGIGMSRDEAVANLGTIARSGTREFFSKLTGDAKADSNLIGQFGVGFYSSFIVARRVVVESRRAGLATAEGVHWESDGTGEYSVETIERPERGTAVTLYLREAEGSGDDAREFDSLLDPYKLRQIVRTYSDHISLPIRMKATKWDEKAKETVESDDWEVVNQARALWLRPKSELKEDDYVEFYKHLTHDIDAPLAYTHNRVEGRTEYTQLLFVPKRAPFDLWDRQSRHGLRLYVRRVFIMADAEQLMPAYLRFIRGVVDSNDLPLNISRELLQESRDVRMIREGCTKRILGMLEDLATNKADDYRTFWTQFGQVLKEGVGEDSGNKERIAGLLRFATTGRTGTEDADGKAAEVADSDEQTVSLADYVGRMKPEQTSIYYVTGETPLAARHSPHLEIFRKKGIEVLVLTDRVDEWMLSFLHEFDGKPLASVARGALDLGKLADAGEKKAHEAAADEFKDLTGRIAAALGDKVKEVRVSDRLTDSAACLVSDEGDISGTLERLLKQAGQKAPPRHPILEINPAHPLVRQLKKAPAEETARFDEWSGLLFDQALLAEGGTLEDPAGFVKRMNELLVSLSLAGR